MRNRMHYKRTIIIFQLILLLGIPRPLAAQQKRSAGNTLAPRFHCLFTPKSGQYEVKVSATKWRSINVVQEARRIRRSIAKLKKTSAAINSAVLKRAIKEVEAKWKNLQKAEARCKELNGALTPIADSPTASPTPTAHPTETVSAVATPSSSATSTPTSTSTPSRPFATRTPVFSPTRATNSTATPTVSPTPLPPFTVALKDSVLVLYNENASDSEDIARYYVSARGINENRLCGVRLPAGYYATMDHVLGARKTIIENCICALIPAAQRPNPCTITNVDKLPAVSPISHIAIIRGVPARIHGHTWPGTDRVEDPPIDIYLSHLLYKPAEDVLPPTGSSNGSLSHLARYQFSAGGMPTAYLQAPLIPAVHKMVAYGRIEASTKDATLALIERTLDAEERGVRGNFLWELNSGDSSRADTDDLGNFLRDLTGSQTASCKDYIAADGLWPYQECRAGGSTSGRVPGENGSTPRAIDVGLFFGQNPFSNISAGYTPDNNQMGFNGNFNTMRHWHSSAYDCTELCKDLGSPAQVAACRAESKDLYRELNTSCVGVARGFAGHQVRSFPVQDYGVYPQGWGTTSAGGTEKVTPRLMDIPEAAYNDTTFTDNKFLRFGGHSVADSTCVDQNGASSACKEFIPLWLERSQLLPPGHTLTAKRYVLRARFRNGASPQGKVRIKMVLETAAQGCARTLSDILPMDAAHTEWQTAQLSTGPLTLLPPDDTASCTDPSVSALTRITISFRSTFYDKLLDYFDLDAVELIDETDSTRLFAADIASFSAPMINNLTNGDYAANVIDRLGGIGWWGSNSHHLTSGFAFANSRAFMGSFFGGRTLGESVLLSGSPESGIIFGDPIYHPVAVKIYLDSGSPALYKGYSGPSDINYRIYGIDGSNPATYQRSLKLSVFHGSAHSATTRWQLQKCVDTPTPALCDASGGWSELAAGQGADNAIAAPVSDLRDLVQNRSIAQSIFLKLRVWNPGEDADALYNLAYMYYTP